MEQGICQGSLESQTEAPLPWVPSACVHMYTHTHTHPSVSYTHTHTHPYPLHTHPSRCKPLPTRTGYIQHPEAGFPVTTNASGWLFLGPASSNAVTLATGDQPGREGGYYQVPLKVGILLSPLEEGGPVLDHGERAVLEQRGCLWPSMWRPLPGPVGVAHLLSVTSQLPLCWGLGWGPSSVKGFMGLAHSDPSFNGNQPRWGHGRLAGLGNLSKRSPAQPHPKGGP